MKIMLVNPPGRIRQRADFPPLGLGYLKSTLIQHDHDVTIVDASGMSWSEISRQLEVFLPDIVGITCWTLGRNHAFEIARIARKIVPEAKIIFGGQHPTAVPQEVFAKTSADVIVMGEGDETIVEVARSIANDDTLADIDGIAFRGRNDIVVNEPRPFVEDIDGLPFPDYSDFHLSEYNGVRELDGVATALMTSRGCPYRCIYCSSAKFWQQKSRLRSASNVLDEMEWLYNDYHVRVFMFFDDLFTLDEQRVVDICKGILDRKMDIRWVACTRVDRVNLEMLRWMKKAGCHMVEYGVESGSPLILKNIKKKVTVDQIIQAFQWTNEVGLLAKAYLMIGNPDESNRTVDETIELAARIRPYAVNSGSLLWVLPNTEVYELAKQNGIISDDYWLTSDDVMYYTAEKSLKQLRALRNRLMLGLAGNRGGILPYLEYLLKRVYFASPLIRYICRKYFIRQKSAFRFFRKRQAIHRN